ncbi:Gfo/Idh/MocA family protein [Heyndrickxia acidicola]|uniref:Gfo/Idh/MocA family oxidoreductase n=1 Tax=Heyndrickxia acidicola TaxID=209389 RepID=A0ABU6MBE6_9BACI|nr:Gfo/Idh/MocA family oxidoreductase [Heyndrickxia acidicola]MED1201744.1 Gfo/Idh/MocA family oxidoreductase [Heyndrickxia acidicola]
MSMLKLGVIGIGDIAQKAYLPLYAEREKIEFHFFTRSMTKRQEISEKYRFPYIHSSLDSLMESGVKGAFVHSATISHYSVIKQLLMQGIHVFVDKPITYEIETAKELSELARSKKLILMTGFNRRYAPSYQSLKDLKQPNMIIMQKNRKNLPADPRTFIFDDCIHVVDTIRYLFPYDIDEIIVHGKMKEKLLYHVTIQFLSKYGTAIGIMNRDSGTTDEKLEIMSTQEKRAVFDVSDVYIYQGSNVTRVKSSDWEPALHKRGFDQMVSDFIQAVKEQTKPMISIHDSLATHEICEKIVESLLKKLC